MEKDNAFVSDHVLGYIKIYSLWKSATKEQTTKYGTQRKNVQKKQIIEFAVVRDVPDKQNLTNYKNFGIEN